MIREAGRHYYQTLDEGLLVVIHAFSVVLTSPKHLKSSRVARGAAQLRQAHRCDGQCTFLTGAPAEGSLVRGALAAMPGTSAVRLGGRRFSAVIRIARLVVAVADQRQGFRAQPADE